MGTLEMLVVHPLYWSEVLTQGATQAVRVGKTCDQPYVKCLESREKCSFSSARACTPTANSSTCMVSIACSALV